MERHRRFFFKAVIGAPYKLLLLGWGAPQVVAERGIGDVYDPDDDHEPGEADGMHNGTPGGGACEEQIKVIVFTEPGSHGRHHGRDSR